MNDSSTSRSPFQGVGQIVRFNWPQYLIGLCVIATCFAVLAFLEIHTALWWIVALAAGCSAFWTCASILASYWVYDWSPLTNWSWLVQELSPRSSAPAARWLNIHSGFDMASRRLREVIAGGEGHVVDLYDPAKMTEASIHRARCATAVDPACRAGRPDELPCDTSSFDVVFLLFAAHEFRARTDRQSLFREASRTLKPDGRAVVVEHLRDGWNFLAFGPGFWHFFSRREWLRVIAESGFRVLTEGRMTPFVRYFILERAD